MTVARRYVARSAAEFDLAIAEWVDESYSATDQIAFDTAAGELVISFEAAPPVDDSDGLPTAAPLGTGVLARSFAQPYLRCRLTVRGVERIQPDLAELIEPVSFGYPEWQADALSLVSNTDSAFTAFGSELEAELEVTEQVVYHRKHLRGRGPVAWVVVGRILR